MNRTKIEELKPNETAKISGFIEKVRDTRYMVFVVVKDLTGKIQVSIDKEKDAALVPDALTLTTGSVATFEGTMQENPAVKAGGKEFIPSSLEILSIADALPINEESDIDNRLDYRWIDLRTERNQLIFKVRTTLEQLMREYFINNGFLEIHTPKITAMNSEGGAEVFKVNYYDQDAYLTQSPQLYKQMAMAAGFEKVFEIGPYYRAEKSSTNRHTCEAICLDIEVSYLKNIEELLKIEQDFLTYVMKHLKEKYGEQVKNIFGLDIEEITIDIPRIKIKDAYDILKTKYNYELPNPKDLDTKGEQLICDYSKEKYGSEFVYITDYDPEARAFYTAKTDDGKSTKAFDLLYRGVELNSGAIREHRVKELSNQIVEHGIDPEHMNDYLAFFSYGCPPHGGFGMGIDRLLLKILGITSNKEVIYIFRGPNRLNP